MVLDLLSLIGAYTAGTFRDQDVPVYNLVLPFLTVVYVIVFHMVLPCLPPRCCHVLHTIIFNQLRKQQQEKKKNDTDHKKERKVLMV
ncbi:hypothetical protein PR202_ga10979 [Eleusine coracana subsp. coracana]|uniref:Uncharacterized protein n=1 Tax=Eleusine coracana subsp. coracana TaxID=191504 RepID=A0AAV5C8C3_ELECO|nr:hypothetical protein PR202_ga10979 [Eleusine coracana subsp. coracana]